MKKKKIIIPIAASILVISSSLAFKDFDQHKTNKFKTLPFTESVVLVENFKKQEYLIPNEKQDKNVFVINGQDTDNATNFDYSSGFVRVELREFLARADVKFEYSSNRYLIDESGNFVIGSTLNEALTKAKKNWANVNSSMIEKINDNYYVKTDHDAPYGIYGKKIVNNKEVTDIISLKNEERISLKDFENKNSMDYHNNSLTDEDTDLYSTIYWKNFIANDELFRKYIKITTGERVITLEEFQSGKRYSEGMWILDTRPNKGWAYWSNPLIHSSKTSNPNFSRTEDIVKSVKLIRNPESEMFYRLHVNMDAVNIDDLELWDDIPKSIKDYYEIKKLNIDVLTDTVNRVKIKLSKATKIERYVPNSYETMLNNLTEAVELMKNLDGLNQLDIDNMAKKLEESLSSFRLNLNYNDELKVGTVIKGFAGHNWTIIHIDDNDNALIVSNPLSESEISRYNFNNFEQLKNKIKYNNTGKYEENGYIKSNLYKINENFYNSAVKNTEYESFVQPVTLIDEEPFQNSSNLFDNYNRTDGASFVDQKNGKKESFTLSISDWNKYSSKEYMRKLYRNSKVWTKTPNIYNKNMIVDSLITSVDGTFD